MYDTKSPCREAGMGFVYMIIFLQLQLCLFHLRACNRAITESEITSSGEAPIRDFAVDLVNALRITNLYHRINSFHWIEKNIF